MGVTSDCKNELSRRRRDISSAVVDNVLQTAEPVNNFLEMTSELFGDESMWE